MHHPRGDGVSGHAMANRRRTVAMNSKTKWLMGVGTALFVAGMVWRAPMAKDPRERSDVPRRSRERMVFRTDYGDLVMAFYPEVAPLTVDHVLRVGCLGGYDTDHFFRVDRGFVAQVADVKGGRQRALSEALAEIASRTVVGEFSKLKHERGTLSMARHQDPDSATTSFSILLGSAPHLDEKYAVFGVLLEGEETLRRLEELETKRDGMFVMPKTRVTIHSSFVYDSNEPGTVLGRLPSSSHDPCLEEVRSRKDRSSAFQEHQPRAWTPPSVG